MQAFNTARFTFLRSIFFAAISQRIRKNIKRFKHSSRTESNAACPDAAGATLCDRPFCFFTKKSERSKVRFDADDVNLLDILILIFLCCID